MTGDLTILDKLAAIIANPDASVADKYAAIEVVMMTRRKPTPTMTLDDYSKRLKEHSGNPTPIDAMALVFGDGRACVCVRLYGSDVWREVMSAPGNAEDGLACGIDCRSPEAVVCAPFTEARGLP